MGETLVPARAVAASRVFLCPRVLECASCTDDTLISARTVAQIAHMNAVAHGCKHVFFSGSFVRHANTVALRVLTYATAFWSSGSLEALFLRHEG